MKIEELIERLQRLPEDEEIVIEELTQNKGGELRGGDMPQILEIKRVNKHNVDLVGFKITCGKVVY